MYEHPRHEFSHPVKKSRKPDSIVELLVGIVIGRASPNLQLDPVGGTAVRDVQTFGASVELDATAGERPLLSCGARAVLNGHDGTVGVGCRGKTFAWFPWLRSRH